MQIEKALIIDQLIFAFQLFIILHNLPMKFAVFLKSSLLLTVSIVFSVYKQNFMVH